jgi:hypothetical protein
MLRHPGGYKLANDGIDTRALQAYLEHRNIQNATRYTALAPARLSIAVVAPLTSFLLAGCFEGPQGPAESDDTDA